MRAPAASYMDVFLRNREDLAREHPAWLQDFEDLDPFVAVRADVEDLIQRAPTAFASGMLCGIFMFRQQLAAVTGREF
jgi:hypothetical protein